MDINDKKKTNEKRDFSSPLCAFLSLQPLRNPPHAAHGSSLPTLKAWMDMLEKYTKKERVRKKSNALREAAETSSTGSPKTPEGLDVIGTSQFTMPDVKSQHFATGAAELDAAEGADSAEAGGADHTVQAVEGGS